MRNIATSFVLVVALLCAACASTSPPQAPSQAKTIFGNYQSLERSFDPAVADLYCDSALIRNVRTYPDGKKRTLELPAPKYKELIRSAMPLAKAKGDYSTYSGVTYAPEGDNVRITATRYSVLKNYSSPMSLLVGACNGGDLAILEEIGESQP
jgi:hypothetical protein